MVIYEKKKDNKIDVIFIIAKSKLPEVIIFLIPKKETAPKIGIESKNVIFAASILLNFNSLAAVIAIPDLLTPGINEKICNKLIKNIISSGSLNFAVINISSILLSFFFSFITIKYFLRYIKEFNLNIFVFYRILLGVVLLYFSYL